MAQNTPEAIPDNVPRTTEVRTEALSTKTESKFTSKKSPTQLTVSEEVSYDDISVCSVV